MRIFMEAPFMKCSAAGLYTTTTPITSVDLLNDGPARFRTTGEEGAADPDRSRHRVLRHAPAARAAWRVAASSVAQHPITIARPINHTS
jgi:hypothetical protein